GREVDRVRVDPGAEAEQRGAAQERAVPLAQLQETRVAVHLHRGMPLEHGALPVHPAAPLARLAVGHAGEQRAEGAAEAAEDLFRARQGTLPIRWARPRTAS